MAEIARLTNEIGDLTEYDSTVTDGGDLSVTSGAALAGTGYGLSFLIDDQTVLRASKNITFSADQVRARFYIDPNGLTMGELEAFFTFRLYRTAGSPWSIGDVIMRYSSGHQLRLDIFEDDASQNLSTPYAITDAPHLVEFVIYRASTNSAADGSAEIWVDGISAGTVSSLDNYDIFTGFNRLDIGPLLDIDAGTSGTYYIDEVVVRDDDNQIQIHHPTIDNETGDLSQYNTTQTDGGDLSVTSGAAIHGSYGLAAVIDDTNNIFGGVTLGSATGVIEDTVRARFYFDPNGMTISNGNSHILATCYLSNTPWHVAQVLFARDVSGNYEINFGLFEDSGTYGFAGATDITDGPHCIEFVVHRATTNSASDGWGQYWIDGSSGGTVTGKDNYDIFDIIYQLRIGAVGGIDSGTSGTYYLDDLEINYSGDEIGLVSQVITPVLFYHHAMMRRL